MATNILMPALSPTMTEGTLARWLKKEGDQVKAGDIIAEIETDKATMEVEAVDEGVIGKILIAAGTEGVKVNTAIAVLLQDGESASDVAAPKAAAAEPAKTEAPVQSEAPAKSDASAPVPAQPKADIPSDPDIPAGTEMVSTTVREALRDAMAEEMRRSERRFTTSASMPCFASCSAACRASPTSMLKATMVTSLPARSIFALPIGRMKSSAVGQSKVWP